MNLLDKHNWLLIVLFFTVVFLSMPACATDDGEDIEWASEEVCRNVCFSRINGGLFSCHQECNQPEEVKLPGGIDFLVKKIRENMFPPVIEKFTTDPSEPNSDKDLTITIEPRHALIEKLETYRVKFFYAFDQPDDWKNSVFAFNPHEREWSTTIYIPGGHARMYYLVRAGDDDGNTYIDIACETSKPAIGSNDCFFPMSKDDTFEGIEDFKIDPALDITNSYIAADSRRFYFRIDTVAGIDPGESLPPTFNYYLVGIFDPGRPADVDPYHKTVFIFYAPYYFPGVTCARNIQDMSDDGTDERPLCITQPCAAISRQGSKWTYDTGSVTCETDGEELFLSIQRKMLEPTSTGAVVTYIATGVIMDLESSIISDYTPSTAVFPRLEPARILLSE